MTVEDVREKVKEIERTAGDDEAAHSMEDRLHLAVLQAIAAGECDDPIECAKLAATTDDIEFCRWCA